MTDEFDLSDDDLKVWYSVSQTVNPMKGKQFSLPEFEEKSVDVSKNNDVLYDYDIEQFFSKTKIKEKKVNLDYLKHGTIKGVDKSTAKRITGGKFKIQARLDLHGMYQDQAFELLRSFIQSNFDNSRRGLLIITGKGSANEGVLKNNVPRWLNSPDIRENIIMFSYAKPKDGGTGALYVLLKRKR